jgi:hypothetical protein
VSALLLKADIASRAGTFACAKGPRREGALVSTIQASFSHFCMKLFLAAPESFLPSELTAFGSHASRLHFFRKLLSAAPASGLPFLSIALMRTFPAPLPDRSPRLQSLQRRKFASWTFSRSVNLPFIPKSVSGPQIISGARAGLRDFSPFYVRVGSIASHQYSYGFAECPPLSQKRTSRHTPR